MVINVKIELKYLSTKGRIKNIHMNNLNFSIILVGLVSYIGYALKNLPSAIGKIIIHNLGYTFSTSTRSRSTYYPLSSWLMTLNVKSLTNNVNARTEWDSSIGYSTKFSINIGKYIFIRKKCLFIVSKIQLDKKFDDIEQLTLTVIGPKLRLIKRELQDVIEAANGLDKIKMYPFTDYTDYIFCAKKSFDNIFISDKDKLTAHINKWLDMKLYFFKHGIIWKTGILLYGKPGTGKTATIRAIATYLNYPIHVINIRSYTSEEQLIRRIAFVQQNSIIVFEDIDCVIQTRENDIKLDSTPYITESGPRVDITDASSESPNKQSIDLLGTLLNLLDGVMSPSGVIFVGTTNHIERLDPALLRDGRFDLKVELRDLGEDLVDQMCLYYKLHKSEILSGEELPINPAYLQNKIISHIKQNNVATSNLLITEEE